MLPPQERSKDQYQEFWRRLVEWSADHRVQLGLQGHDAVVRHLALNGWPKYDPPHCPVSLKREAIQAVSRLVGAGAREAVSEASEIPSLHPEYAKDEDFGAAFALDMVEQHDDSLMAAATSTQHWSEETLEVSLDPPPPARISLVFEPHVEFELERRLRARSALDGMRLKIVGGLPMPEFKDQLREQLAVNLSEVVWLPSEKKKQPPLDCLKGMRPDVDVLICVTGKMGHAASEKAIDLAVASGIEPILVEKPSDIVLALEVRFGR